MENICFFFQQISFFFLFTSKIALSRLFKEMSSSIRHGHVNPSQFRSTFIQLESKFNGCEYVFIKVCSIK